MTKIVAYYEELPLAMVIKAEETIEKALHDKECERALHCNMGPVFVELKMKDGSKVYVARDDRHKYTKEGYICKVQLLTEDLEVLDSATYIKNGDECKRLDGYPIRPLMDIAAKAIRIGKKAQSKA